MMFLLGSKEYVDATMEKIPALSQSLPFTDLEFAYQQKEGSSVIRFENEGYEFIFLGKIYGISSESIPELIISNISSSGFSSIFHIDGDFLLFLFQTAQ